MLVPLSQDDTPRWKGWHGSGLEVGRSSKPAWPSPKLEMACEVTSEGGQPDLLVLCTLPIRAPPPPYRLLLKAVSAGRQSPRQAGFHVGTLAGDKDSGSFQR